MVWLRFHTFSAALGVQGHAVRPSSRRPCRFCGCSWRLAGDAAQVSKQHADWTCKCVVSSFCTPPCLLLPLCRYGGVDVAVCVQDKSGQESRINECLLGKTATGCGPPHCSQRAKLCNLSCVGWCACRMLGIGRYRCSQLDHPVRHSPVDCPRRQLFHRLCIDHCGALVLKSRSRYVGIAGMNAALVQLAPN